MEFFEWLFMEGIGQAVFWVIFAGGAIVIKKLKLRWPTVPEYFPVVVKATLLAIVIIVAFNQLHKFNETIKGDSRPYFSRTEVNIQNISETSAILSIGMRNNERAAEHIIKQVLIIEESLDPTIEPLQTERIEFADSIGPDSIFNIFIPFKIREQDGARFAFIVLQIRYIDAISKETYTQSMFMKFSILRTEDNSYIPRLELATKNDKSRIESYIKNRNIPMLEL